MDPMNNHKRVILALNSFVIRQKGKFLKKELLRNKAS